MIIAIGTDIASSERISSVYQRRGNAFARRILTVNEYVEFEARNHSMGFLTRRFSAKEAVAKALGTGIGRGLSFHHIEVLNNELGAPILTLSGFALQRSQRMGVKYQHISISDERNYAVSFVVLSA